MSNASQRVRETNQSVTSDFTLTGLFNHSGPHLALFSLVAAIFTMGLLGNAILIFLIHTDARLHTPMYYLLSQLSLLDVGFPLVTIPKMAADFLQEKKAPSPMEAVQLQMFFLMLIGVSEASCYPLCLMTATLPCATLRYPVLMRPSGLPAHGGHLLVVRRACSLHPDLSITLHFPYSLTHCGPLLL